METAQRNFVKECIMLYYLFQFLPLQAMVIIYYSLIKPAFPYDVLVLGYSLESFVNKLDSEGKLILKICLYLLWGLMELIGVRSMQC